MREGCDLSRCGNAMTLFAYLMSGSLALAELLAGESPPSSEAADGPREGTGLAFRMRPLAERCIEALMESQPRSLPALVSEPTLSPEGFEHGEFPAGRWLEPFPDEMVPTGLRGNRRRLSRECVSLEFAGVLQTLEPVTRAALVLCDVFGLSESEATGLTGIPGGALGAARETLARSCSRRGRREPPSEGEAAGLIMRYIFNWEAGKADGLCDMLADGVVLQSPPSSAWFEGRDQVSESLRREHFAAGRPGRWRLLPTRANGQVAFAAYIRSGTRRFYEAHSIQVVYFNGTRVSEVIVFSYPRLFPPFGLQEEVVVQGLAGS